MLASIRQLILVTIGIILCIFVTWFLLLEYGESKVLQEPTKHPFLTELLNNRPAIVCYAGDAEFPDNTLEGFAAALEKNPNAILWADVRPAADGTLMLFRETDFALTTDGHGWVDYTEPRDIAKLNAGYFFKDTTGQLKFRDHPLRIPTLVEFLRRFPKQKLVLNFLNNRPGLDEKITSLIDQEKASARILIQSPEEGLLRDLRQEKPDWLFGASRARNTQLKMLASVGLASLASFGGDLYVSEYQIGQNIMFNDEIRSELQRRKLPFIIGPIQDKSLAQSLIQSGARGIITKDVQLLN